MKLQHILFFIPFLWACNEKFTTNDLPVAKVFDKYLLKSEVTNFIPTGTSTNDSLIMAQSYVRNWITRELLLHKATQNLNDEEKNIRKQVEDYSSSILIHKYKEKLISQKLSREVSEREIAQYYDANKFNFILNTPVVRALFVVIPKSVPNIDNPRKWFRSKEAKDQEALEEYCITSARKYDNFNDQWIELRNLLNLLPITSAEWESKYKNKEYIEIEDDENYYFLKINEIRQEHETAPLGYVQKEIEILLLNKRKISFEENLEKDINAEGIRKDYVKIY
ncbi:peptidyl-prolyl cis-trans isomerase [Butyricimonas paravirosa]|uniref:peptidyl-prolyl cis-trans isomerase n=1 Tax=Butyricimonas paravirosa TaxID=1472417 RepID=UPI00210CBE48|nr:peptidyl-prolyl cis-trans isomerase [Butyricimonas paravirosa]MCQ4874124.1 peptidyl-prolyl cis-trans isomerase [Butyricimonas paravirosa]